MAQWKSSFNGTYQLIFEIKTKSQDKANNKSTLQYRMFVRKTSGSGYYAYDMHPWSIKINGSIVASGSWTYDFRNYTEKTLQNWKDITLTHKSDGTLSVSVEATAKMYGSLGTASIKETYTGIKITRSINDFVFRSGWSNTTSSKSITFTKSDSSIRAQLEWRYYNNKYDSWGNIRVVSTRYTSGSSFSFSSEDINLLHTQNPNSREVTIQVTLKSYSGSTLTKTINKSIKIRLKAEIPTISSTYTIIGKNQNLLESTKQAVANIHSVKVSQSASAKNGATIKSITAELNGKILTGSNPEVLLSKVGTNTIKIKAVDSRGYTATKELSSFNVKTYRPPTISNFRTTRMNGGEEHPLGTTGVVRATINTSRISNTSGVNINNPWWKISFQGSTNSNSSSVYATTTVAATSTRAFTLEFGDAFRTLSIKGIIPRGGSTLVLGENSVGIGVIPPKGGEGLYLDKSMINGIAIPEFEDFTSQCTSISGVSGLRAYKYGRIAMIRFNYKPTQTGFIRNIVTAPSGYTPMTGTSGTVATFSNSNDLTLGVGFYGDTTGGFRLSVPSVPSSTLTFTIVYMTIS